MCVMHGGEVFSHREEYTRYYYVRCAAGSGRPETGMDGVNKNKKNRLLVCVHAASSTCPSIANSPPCMQQVAVSILISVLCSTRAINCMQVQVQRHRQAYTAVHTAGDDD